MLEQSAIDALRHVPVPPAAHFIGGRDVPSEDGATMGTVSPIDGRPLARIAAGSAADAGRAVASAREAFEDGRWAGLPPADRKRTLLRLADLVEGRALELAVLGVRDNGTEINMAFQAEPLTAAANFRYYAEAIDKVYGEIAPTPADTLALVHRVPVGVVAAIVPWNFPLMIGSWKVAPALAAGNSVVLKPAESASLSLLRLAALAAEAGVPEGVLNVVTGPGETVGEALALSPDVDAVAFTGSGATGRRLLECSARSNLKRCHLELGGKSPNIVFADAPDLAQAARVSATGMFRNSGQVCVAGSRLLVQRDIHEEFVREVCECADGIRVGDPLELSSQVGAVHSLQALESDLGFVRDAEAAGARRRTGGERILAGTGGYYMRPTVMDAVRPQDRLAQEEVFGPVLAVTAFDGEEEALRIANGTVYGLAAGVWTSDLSRAHRMVAGIRAGVVHVNCYGGADLTVPLGGHRQSGNGHDKSLHALDKYVDLKAAWIRL